MSPEHDIVSFRFAGLEWEWHPEDGRVSGPAGSEAAGRVLAEMLAAHLRRRGGRHIASGEVFRSWVAVAKMPAELLAVKPQPRPAA